MSAVTFTTFALGKYRAVELLGKGGFGTVFRAIDTTLDREVALKVLHPQLVSEPNFVARFRNEAKTIAALRHPNVVGVYELGEENGRLFIAMEYMPGGTLKDRIAKQGRLSFAETLHIMQQVCAGLDAAHAKGMIHRDIKPANILFGPEGQAVVSDFGLARAVEVSSLSSSSSSIGGVGTSFYRAPELWNGKPPASPATDVYALACMVYEMLMGHTLFDGDTPAIIMTKHVLHGPDFGADWPPSDAPQGLAEIVQRGIAHNPEDRCPSAKAFAEALAQPSSMVMAATSASNKDVDGDTPGEAKPASATRTPSTSKRILAAALLLPLILIGGWLLLRNGRPGETPVMPLDPSPSVAKPATLSAGSMAATSTDISATPTPVASPAVPALGIGSKQVSDTDGMTLLYVPAGEFIMGDNTGESDEQPAHTVYLDAFWIDQTEVTNAMFKKFVNATGYQTDAVRQGSGFVFDTAKQAWSDTPGANWQHPRGPDSDLSGLDNHPVVQISWNDARAYCEWAGRQLPTEAQWEKAARWDEVNKRARIYPWGDQTVANNLLNSADRNLNIDRADKSIDDGYQFIAPVGHYPVGASPYGALDMAGNAWEWVADWYAERYYDSSPTRNPENTTESSTRVLRGGAWDTAASTARASNRDGSIPTNRGDGNGFRCVRSESPNASKLVTTTPSPPFVGTAITPTLGIGSTKVSDKDDMILLYVPVGEFIMGRDDGASDENPPHEVHLDAFWIDQTEVTNAMFKKFVDVIGYQTDAELQGSGYVFDPAAKTWRDVKGADWQHPQGPDSTLNGLGDHPVALVSWNDAKAYCDWAGRRLPTEAEWEKAARGDDQRTYPWGNQALAGNLLNFADSNLDVAWADKSANDGYQFSAPVGSYPAGASPYGALDMSGNVWEWVADWYDAAYYASSPTQNPPGASRGTSRVQRGGSWDNVEDNLPSSVRHSNAPTFLHDNDGFRCALSESPSGSMSVLASTLTPAVAATPNPLLTSTTKPRTAAPTAVARPKTDILNVNAWYDNKGELDLTVDYIYGGEFGTEEVHVECRPQKISGDPSGFTSSYGKNSVQVGKGTAGCGMSNGAFGSVTSDEIVVCIVGYSHLGEVGRYCRTYPYRKVWG